MYCPSICYKIISFSQNLWRICAGYYDYDDYYNNMQGYEAYMQKWAIIFWEPEKALTLLSLEMFA